MFRQPAITAAAVAPKGRVETCAAVNTALFAGMTAANIDAGMRHERGCQADPIKPVTIPELLTE